MSELRAPDPTLTAHVDGDVFVQATEPGGEVATAHRRLHSTFVGELLPSSFARWFAVPCRTCWPDAPEPGHVWSRYVLGRVEPGVAPYLAWVPGLAWQTQVSIRGGETARADEPAGPAKGGNPAGDEPQDVAVAAGATHGAPSDTGKCPDNSISVSEHATTPTTPLARLRDVTEAALVAEASGWHDADAIHEALDALIGAPRADAEFIAAFSPDVAYVLLVVAEAATAFVDGGRSFIGGPLRDAVDRLREETR